MVDDIIHIQSGDTLDEQEDLNLADLCRICTVETETIVTMVEEGILEPRGESATSWSFPVVTVLRVRKIQRLQQDLGVNLAGAGLAMHLLDRIDQLYARLRALGAEGRR